MDVAGTAVGIISLGIQVFQGLLQYYNDWKDYSADISTTATRLQRVKAILEQLEPVLTDVSIAEEKRNIIGQTISACEEAFRKLEKRLKKIQSHGRPKGSAKAQFLTQLHRTWYPFQKSTLLKLQEIVTSIQDEIQLALSVLQIDIQLSSKGKLDDIDSQIYNLGVQLKAINNQNERLIAGRDVSVLKDALAWLNSPSAETNYRSALALRETDTGRWFLDSKAYVKWKYQSKLGGGQKHSWLYGKPGSGKTVLSATTIQDLVQYCTVEPNMRCIYFYFSFREREKQSYQYCLRSLVSQFSDTQLGSECLIESFEAHETASGTLPPDTKKLEELLCRCATPFETIFLVLDALDECPDFADSSFARSTLLTSLSRLMLQLPCLRILATSRDLPDIRNTMIGISASMLLIDAASIESDIDKYVASQLANHPRFSKLGDSMKQEIQAALTQKADGMFQWVDCQIRLLKDLRSTKPSVIRTILLSLPKDLDDTYAQMIQKIPEMLHEEAIKLLRWLAYSMEPLTLQQLAEVTIIEPYHGDGMVDYDDRGDTDEALLVLGAFLQIDGDVVRLAHFSVKEYLESDRLRYSQMADFWLQQTVSHRYLTDACVAYLRKYCHGNASLDDQEHLDMYPLLFYSAKYWFQHLKVDEPGTVGLERLLIESSQDCRTWLQIYNPLPEGYRQPYVYDQPQDQKWPHHELPTPLYFASHLGLKSLTLYLLQQGWGVNQKSSSPFFYPIIAAAAEGHTAVVKILTEFGANLNLWCVPYSTEEEALGFPLGAAVHQDNFELADYLLENKADIDLCAGSYTALQLSIREGRHQMIDFLLDHGADVNTKGKWTTALIEAVRVHDEALVGRLISLGADPNGIGFQNTGKESQEQISQGRGDGKFMMACPLSSAITESMSRLLIAAGAKVNPEDPFTSVPLVAAASRANNSDVVRFLLENGANVHARGGHWHETSALQNATRFGGAETVRLLLAHGANVAEPHPNRESLAQVASLRKDVRLMQVLIDFGVDVNEVVAWQTRPAVSTAVDDCNTELVRLLLRVGASQSHALSYAKRNQRKMIPIIQDIINEIEKS